MRLDGRRSSNNIDDRRRMSVGKRAGIGGGIVGVIIVAVVTLLSGGGVGDILTNVMGSGALNGGMEQGSEYVETDQDAYLADFTSKILAGTEDVWTQEFRKNGWGEY